MSVTVINGEVEVGSQVAYATREGNLPAIHKGTVVEITTWGGKPALKIEVEFETPYMWARSRVRTVHSLDRVLLLV